MERPRTRHDVTVGGGHPVVDGVGAGRTQRHEVDADHRAVDPRFAGGPQVAVGPTTVIAPNDVCRCSLNVADTWCGPVATTASTAGSVAMRTACADAVGAVVSAMTASSTPSSADAADFMTVAACTSARPNPGAPTISAAPPSQRAVLSGAGGDDACAGLGSGLAGPRARALRGALGGCCGQRQRGDGVFGLAAAGQRWLIPVHDRAIRICLGGGEADAVGVGQRHRHPEQCELVGRDPSAGCGGPGDRTGGARGGVAVELGRPARHGSVSADATFGSATLNCVVSAPLSDSLGTSKVRIVSPPRTALSAWTSTCAEAVAVAADKPVAVIAARIRARRVALVMRFIVNACFLLSVLGVMVSGRG